MTAVDREKLDVRLTSPIQFKQWLPIAPVVGSFYLME
jgi:hypothetical protein